jgi:hypothetical protein
MTVSAAEGYSNPVRGGFLDSMPTLPWTSGPYVDDAPLHVLTSTLPLNRYLDVPRFLHWTLKIRKQLRDAPGLAGYSLDARLPHKTFWTLSAWQDREAMEQFVRSGAHAAMLADMAGRLGPSRFVESTAARADLPLDWSAARQRVGNAD